MFAVIETEEYFELHERVIFSQKSGTSK